MPSQRKINVNKRNFLNEWNNPMNYKTVKELAHKYGVSLQTANKWINNDLWKRDRDGFL